MTAFFRSSVASFLETEANQGVDKLATHLNDAGFDVKPDQRMAWNEEWKWLASALRVAVETKHLALNWVILLEYPIPGRQKRIDAVLLTTRGVLVIEFKRGEATNAARWQVREYCWNLRDFHRQSRGVPIAPILCIGDLPEAKIFSALEFVDRGELVLDVQTCDAKTLSSTLLRVYERLENCPFWDFDAVLWDESRMEPTPSIIEFAQRIYEGHDVREIDHAQADDNTEITLLRIRAAINEARGQEKRIICFVTGVPGAGKTLVGLRTAYNVEMTKAAGGPVCFASGNKPLLGVLKTALVRNRARNQDEAHGIGHGITALIQDVHDYVRELLSKQVVEPPPFQVVVFDEAQRVWNATKLADGLKTRLRYGNLTQIDIDRILVNGGSEPDLLLSLMERCPKWCVVIALVGGGQEIHNGEAGLGAWGQALGKKKDGWTIWASTEAMRGGIGNPGQQLFQSEDPIGADVILHDDLHLKVSKRALRAERYSEWVNHVVIGNVENARNLTAQFSEFAIHLARDLNIARAHIEDHADDGLRYGLIASSGAIRLRSEGVEVSPEFRSGIKFSEWFLRPKGDIRSCNQLEIAATEFECQGLELDWCCVCWGGDFVMKPKEIGWSFQRLRTPGGNAPRWCPEKSRETQEFIRNKYRVLLTRSRVGVVIYVPRGSNTDSTRDQSLFDATARFLCDCGATLI